MGYFELVRKNVETENFDLINFLTSRSPLTPKSDHFIVSMAEFRLDELRDCIIYNIYCQGLSLKTETSRKLIAFLEADFSDLTKKAYLQVLVHYTKMDIDKTYDSYSAAYDKSGMPSNEKLSCDAYFDNQIEAFVMHADSPTHTTNEIVKISGETKDLVRNALLAKPVLLALKFCLNNALKSDSTFNEYSIEWFENEISDMQIFMMDKFAPLKGLRGACLLDGILLCIGELDHRREVHKADLITLAAHECAHYLARRKFSDFNFSSPFKFLPEFCEKRPDLVIPKMNLEIGRTVEILLFDGIQPCWFNSSEDAAKHFLDGLFSSLNYPVIPKAKQKSLGLKTRIPPTSSFGIDTDEYDLFC